MKNSRIVLAVLALIALAATGYSVADRQAAKAGADCCAAGGACCDNGGSSCCN
jgi:hypothetical protein